MMAPSKEYLLTHWGPIGYIAINWVTGRKEVEKKVNKKGWRGGVD
jgi:hypothetical protein